MSDNTIGTDGRYPVVDNEPLWRIWSLEQIWRGEAGENRYVPKIKDWVVDPDNGDTWIVDHLDPVTLVPTLRQIQFGGVGVLSENDKLLGVGPGAPSDVYRVYLNTAVFPHTLAVDTGCGIKGSMSTYAKIFLGTDTTEATGVPISKVYDNSGNFISTAVPLELIEIDSHNNLALKAIRRCNCTAAYPNGELVTVVIYADDGHVVYKRQMMIENTDTIADVNVGLKYISEISLECQWLANQSTDVIRYPLNLPMDSLNMIGVVHYSDGSVVKYPVDGQKFTMDGLTTHVSSIPGQSIPLSLRYQLGAHEVAYASTGVNLNKITKPFTLITDNQNSSIQVKLFGYPEWQGNAIGYTMRWFLMNMDRSIYFDVTGKVQFAENTGEFNPKLYGYLQRKSVSVNLQDVSPTFISYIYTQSVDIILKQPPSADVMDSWMVRTESGDTAPAYGHETYGRIMGDGSKVNLGCAFANQAAWLDAFYLKTRPLVNALSETAPMQPTHFALKQGETEQVFPISSWNADLALKPNLVSGSLVSIRFFKETPTNRLQLAYAAVILKRF